MSEYKSMYNPDYRKYGLGEVDYLEPSATQEEPEVATPETTSQTVISHIKARLQKKHS